MRKISKKTSKTLEEIQSRILTQVDEINIQIQRCNEEIQRWGRNR